jgi:REase_DpnII-MboI/Uncharacterized protein conserved in bacteria (DUF2321)
MTPEMEVGQDVMQVCRNGHVVTDRLHCDPDSGRYHCDRCGALTLHECPTCGIPLPGAGNADGLVPIGVRPAPRYCSTCGVAFPWVRNVKTSQKPLAQLEEMLHRLPLVIRQFRWRQGEKPPYCVEDERDLTDLLRALLHLHFDDVRLESRTPSYSAGTRTDLLLASAQIAVTMKFVRLGTGEQQLANQFQEDGAFYRKRGGCRRVIEFVYDPAGLLRDSQVVEKMVAACGDDLEVRCIVGGKD